MAQWAGEDLQAEDYPTWRATFRLLGRSRQDPLVVVLDEFQYLMSGSEEGVTSPTPKMGPAGFTPTFVERAKADSRIRLATLEDFYAS